MSLPPERELIELLTERAEHDRNEAGFVDDCAIVPFGETDLVLTIDSFAEESHFPPGTPPGSAGRMATEAAISDLAAAGAEVVGVLAAYGLPDRLTRAQAREMGQAVAGTVEGHGGEVLGGDTKPRDHLELAITALGECPRGSALSRSGARPGDTLLVTGVLGGAGAALDRIRSGLDPRQADPLLAPEARIQAGLTLRESGANACIDLSDGLADGAVAIAEASEVQLVVEADAVELHPWAAEDERGLDWALTTGGDYELLAAVPDESLDRVEAAWDAIGLSPSRIGRVETGSGAVLTTDEGESVLERGYEHRFGGTS